MEEQQQGWLQRNWGKLLTGCLECGCLLILVAGCVVTAGVAYVIWPRTPAPITQSVNPPAPVAPVQPVAPVAKSDPWGLNTMSVADAQKWLSTNIGGSPEKWTSRNDEHTMWGYWDPDHPVTFKHPGQNSMLTYWSGFAEPQNARGCWVQIPKKSDRWDGTTRTVQCPLPGATFSADGVGFHPIAPNN